MKKPDAKPMKKGLKLFCAVTWTAAGLLWIWNIGQGGSGLNVLAMAVSVAAAGVWWRRWWRHGKEKAGGVGERPPQR